MKSSNPQSHQMQSELMRLLMGIVVATIFSLIGFYSFLGTQPSFLWSAVGLISFMLGYSLTPRLGRAYLFYIWAFTLALVNSTLLFDSSLRLIFVGGLFANLSLGWLISLGMGLTIFGLWSQYQIIRMQLQASLDHNIKSGRLNLKHGFWNFDMPLYFDSPDKENKKMMRFKRLSQLSPIVTALGFAVARAVDGGLQTVGFGICLYVLGCIAGWGSVKYLAITFQLLEWERTFQIEIEV